MASTVRPTGTLLVGLISGVIFGALLPLAAAAVGVLSWPGGADGDPGLGWRSGLAGLAVVLAARVTSHRAGSGPRSMLAAATGALVGVPIASTAASWSQLYGGTAGPVEAALWGTAGVIAGTIITGLLADRVPRPTVCDRDEWRLIPDRPEIEWARLDLQEARTAGFSRGPGDLVRGRPGGTVSRGPASDPCAYSDPSQRVSSSA